MFFRTRANALRDRAARLREAKPEALVDSDGAFDDDALRSETPACVASRVDPRYPLRMHCERCGTPVEYEAGHLTESGGVHCDACWLAARPVHRPSISERVEWTVGPPLYRALRVVVGLLKFLMAILWLVLELLD